MLGVLGMLFFSLHVASVPSLEALLGRASGAPSTRKLRCLRLHSLGLCPPPPELPVNVEPRIPEVGVAGFSW